MQADSHGVLLFSERAAGEKPIPSLLPFACIKMQKVVSLEVQAHCHCHIELFSCGSVQLKECPIEPWASWKSCPAWDKGFNSLTSFFLLLLYPETERFKETISEISSCLEILRFWWKSCLGFSAQRRHRWNKMCPLILVLFSMWLKPVLKCK